VRSEVRREPVAISRNRKGKSLATAFAADSYARAVGVDVRDPDLD